MEYYTAWESCIMSSVALKAIHVYLMDWTVLYLFTPKQSQLVTDTLTIEVFLYVCVETSSTCMDVNPVFLLICDQIL